MAQWRHVWPCFYNVFDRMRWRMVDRTWLIMTMIDGMLVFSFRGHWLRENSADRYECARQAGCNNLPSIEHRNS
jgi:hypothetical protein